jgi:hypothetical protein
VTRASQHYGKKIGKLTVKLDRKKSRYKWASVEVDLRVEVTTGMFYAQYDGTWYSADTKDDLEAQIKVAATKALSIEWKRYIKISYSAEGFPIEDETSGRPAKAGQYTTFDIDDRRVFNHHRAGKGEVPFAICSISLHWSICEISEPYPLPEDPKKMIRARREIGIWRWGEDIGKEKIGEPDEWENDVIPSGTFLWTPEREAVLVEIIGALGKLDQRLVDLFSGDAAQLAAKIDAATQTDPSRLLAAPESLRGGDGESPTRKRSRQ